MHDRCCDRLGRSQCTRRTVMGTHHPLELHNTLNGTQVIQYIGRCCVGCDSRGRGGRRMYPRASCHGSPCRRCAVRVSGGHADANLFGSKRSEPHAIHGTDAGSGGYPQMMRIACSATIASPNVTSRLRIGSAV